MAASNWNGAGREKYPLRFTGTLLELASDREPNPAACGAAAACRRGETKIFLVLYSRFVTLGSATVGETFSSFCSSPEHMRATMSTTIYKYPPILNTHPVDETSMQ